MKGAFSAAREPVLILKLIEFNEARPKTGLDVTLTKKSFLLKRIRRC